MRKFISFFCFFIGIIIILYPKIEASYRLNQQSKILGELQNFMDNTDENQNLINEQIPIDELLLPQDDLNAFAILNIEKINLNIPVLKDATNQNLKISVATIEPSINPGEIGNLSIAGHNSYDYGHNFNRLEELEVEDTVILKTAINSYQYKIYEKFYVTPNEISVLDTNGVDKELTLITCYPRETGEKRLIIKAICN